MFQPQSPTIPLDFWISYSGQQKQLVEDIRVAMLENEKEISDDYFKNNPDNGVLQKTRFDLETYQWQKSDSGEWEPKLEAGQSILELVQAISGNLLRAMVITPDYLQSKTCMQELCMSLCSLHIESEVFPLLIVQEISNPETTLLSSNLSCAIPFEDNGTTIFINKQVTLAAALSEMHHYICKQIEKGQIKRWQGYNLEPLQGNYFQGKLEKLLGKTYGEVGKHIKCIDKSKQVGELARSIYGYGVQVLGKSGAEELARKTTYFVESLYSRKAIRELGNKLKFRNQAELLARIEKINSESDFLSFCKKIAEIIEDYPEILHPTLKGLIYKLCSVCLFHCSQTVYLFQFQRHLKVSTFFQVNSLKSGVNFQNQLYAVLVMMAVFDFIPSVKLDTPLQTDNVSSWGVSNFVNTSSLAESDDGSDNFKIKAIDLLRTLAFELFLTDIPERKRAEDIENNSELLRELREHIIKPLNPDSRLCLLLCEAADKHSTDYFPVLSNAFEILNKNLEEDKSSVNIPAFVLKAEGKNRNEKGLKVSFNQYAYNGIKEGLRVIEKAFQQHENPSNKHHAV